MVVMTMVMVMVTLENDATDGETLKTYRNASVSVLCVTYAMYGRW